MLATPAYDAPSAGYTYSMALTREAMAHEVIDASYILLSGDCHVDDARNRIVAEFLRSDCDDLIFIDADVSWEPEALLALLEAEGDIVGAVYPFKEDGTAGKAPAQPLGEDLSPDASGRLLMSHIPTGFMRISRRVLAMLVPGSKSYEGQDGRPIPVIFERTLTEGDRVGRLGGDVNFCHKARGHGFSVYALPEIVLEHGGKRGSYAGILRRQRGRALWDVCAIIGSEDYTLDHIREARDAAGNEWSASVETLAFAVQMAENAKGHILECGSGLSTVLMAAALPDHLVYALEHDPLYAEMTRRMAVDAGVTNIAIVTAPLVDGWYALDDFADMPARFAFALVDGPPRGISDRALFFKHAADKCGAVICDDADTLKDAMVAYAPKRGWAELARHGRAMMIGEKK